MSWYGREARMIHEAESGLREALNEGSSATCKFCNHTGLHWRETGGGWRLSEPDGNLHRCKEYMNERRDYDRWRRR